MWPTKKDLVDNLTQSLIVHSRDTHSLPGIEDAKARDALVMQIVASVRRLEYTDAIKRRPIDATRADPNSPLFDPERAAILHARAGDLDEAFWLTFLATHFGKHGHFGWKRLQDVYSGLGHHHWTWGATTANPEDLYRWLRTNHQRIGGAFSNHRKYETLSPTSKNGTINVIRSYIDWIGAGNRHQYLIDQLIAAGGNDPRKIFDEFYRSMNVHRFGRLGKFDFLALVGRLDLAPITPGSAYLKGATGPLKGARLLFGGDANSNMSSNDLQSHLTKLDNKLDVGMQVLEDSLCNWQKSPKQFRHFRG